MQDSIFTVELPLVDNNEKLNLVKALYPDYDPYYIASGCIKDRREEFDKMWKTFRPLADKNFLSDLRKHFHQRTWEMYLGNILIKNRLDVSSINEGPDFVINKDKENEIFIEAVACERGTAEDAVPEMFIANKSEKMIAQNIPHDEMLLRLANSLDSKYKKYKDFVEEKRKPYVIAINRGDLQHVDMDTYLIFKVLFGLGYLSLNIPLGGGMATNSWTRREYIKKKNGEKVSMTFFEKEEHNIVSAVIYSYKDVLNHPEVIGSDCIVVHNPKAKFPLGFDTFSFLQQYKTEYKDNNIRIDKIES